MQPRRDRDGQPRTSVLRRWGPIAAVMAVIVGLTAVAFRGGNDGGGDDTRAEPTNDRGTTASTASTANTARTETTMELADSVVPSSAAPTVAVPAERFPDTCDTESGMVAIPFIFRSECFADVDENGGETAPGVTGDTIKVVAWIPAEDDPIRALLLERVGLQATNDELRELYAGFVEIFQRYYQTYGRTVELHFVEASGTILDNVAARADAVRAAEEFGAFAVLGGPLLGNAWTEELHARGIVCIACPGISGSAPSVFSIPPTNGQIRRHLANYVVRKLAGGQAAFAGADLQGAPRVFGLLSLGAGEADERGAAELEGFLADEGVALAERILYPLDPGRAAELATNAVARMKAAGVTTVLVQADPISLPAFTQEATKQQWYPEWVLGAAPFIDTTAFARTFDPAQWEHAFGISYFPPQVAAEASPPIQLYEWFHGEPPAVQAAIPLLLLYPQVVLLFTGLEYAGPELTVESFRDGLFTMPPTARTVTQPSVSYGEQRWESPDYAGVDDMVEIWWDPQAVGPDEGGAVGTGMYRYVNGAERHLADEWDDELAVFEPAGSVTIIEDIPVDERPPEYPPPD